MVDQLIASTKIVIDRPRGSVHPRFEDFVYPVDYGYLEGTASMDGGGTDVWVSTDPAGEVNVVLCVVDLMKGDSEIKILIGCTKQEKERIYQLHNETQFMKGILIQREE